MHIDPKLHAQARLNTLVLSLSSAVVIAICVGLMVGALVYPAGYMAFGFKGLGFAYMALGMSVLAGIAAGVQMAVVGYRHQYPVEFADLTKPRPARNPGPPEQDAPR
ncbi:hypothetical protein CKO28_03585 [Rhodovibrio sodomensis]|uniref:Uncharacterized protein n=1 Tax=Rhodovibrio sodomensis TaxID=1088 RepID=A0ABS1D9M7_9PROT|nr:hypothetical protein [Rhodovibrio sodomensis]MBK1667126.1 hypothetical protein [Rhodovibrio sodomensis]